MTTTFEECYWKIQWPPGIDPVTVRVVAQRLNHYATPGPKFGWYRTKISGTLDGDLNILRLVLFSAAFVSGIFDLVDQLFQAHMLAGLIRTYIHVGAALK